MLAIFKSIQRSFNRSLITGLLVVIPIGMTVVIVRFIVVRLDRMIEFLPALVHPRTYLPFDIPGIGIVFAVAMIMGIGALARNYLGGQLVHFGHNIISRIPLVSKVYQTVFQVVNMILRKDTQSFRRVVLVEYPRPGIWCLALTTGKSRGEVQEKTKREVINIFLPTTPNPTSGFYLMVPKEDVTELSMSVEEAFRIIISAGVVSEEDGDQMLDLNGVN